MTPLPGSVSWNVEQLLEAVKQLPPAKFAAKMVLGAVLPCSPAVVDLIGAVLDCVHETAKDQLIFEERSLAAIISSITRSATP